MNAVDKTIVMGSAIGGNALKAAADAHHEAMGSIDAQGVTSTSDYEAVHVALRRVIAFVPSSKVMNVYNSLAEILPGPVTNNMFSGVNPLGANAAAKAFYGFKDAVKAAQQWVPKCFVQTVFCRVPGPHNFKIMIC